VVVLDEVPRVWLLASRAVFVNEVISSLLKEEAEGAFVVIAAVLSLDIEIVLFLFRAITHGVNVSLDVSFIDFKLFGCVFRHSNTQGVSLHGCVRIGHLTGLSYVICICVASVIPSGYI
jgi:hypothetical protein